MDECLNRPVAEAKRLPIRIWQAPEDNDEIEIGCGRPFTANKRPSQEDYFRIRVSLFVNSLRSSDQVVTHYSSPISDLVP